jgi:outer membrane lipoprotein-sorting protein
MNIRVTKISLIALFLSFAFISNSSFARGSHVFWIKKTFENLNKIENYSATSEQSLLSGNALVDGSRVISQVNYQRPNDFHSIITSPESLKGIEASFSNHAISLNNPKIKKALNIKGLKSPTVESKLDQVKGLYYYNQKHYDQVFTPSIHIAEQLSVGLDFIAKRKEAELLKAETYINYHHSIFMQVSQSFDSGVTSTFKNTAITFNQNSFTLPKTSIAENTQLLEWDFNQASLTNKESLERISSEIHWPKDIENYWGLSQRQFYQQRNAKTAAGYFYNDAFFVITITQPNESIAKTAEETSHFTHGIPLIIKPLKGESTVLLAQYPEFSYLEFVRDNIRYSLIANIHPQSLIDMAHGMIIEEK